MVNPFESSIKPGHRIVNQTYRGVMERPIEGLKRGGGELGFAGV
jgi:hypothetical protein